MLDARKRAIETFRVALWRQQDIEVFWHWQRRRLITRGILGRLIAFRALPDDALRIGHYRHPFAADDFARDLDAALILAGACVDNRGGYGAMLPAQAQQRRAA